MIFPSKLRKKKEAAGFTLIEVMICVAIMAIFLTYFFEMPQAFRRFRLENDYSHACFLGAEALLRIRSATPFPPEVHVIPPSLTVPLNNTPLHGSVEVYQNGRKLSPNLYRLREYSRKIFFSPMLKGEKIVVDYSMPFLVWEEVRDVPGTPPNRIFLENNPVEKIKSVKVAEGNQLVPVSPSNYKVDPGEGLLFSPSFAGKVVVVDYTGKKMRGFLTGTFLSPGFKQKNFIPAPWKFLKLTFEEEGAGPWPMLFTIKKS